MKNELPKTMVHHLRGLADEKSGQFAMGFLKDGRELSSEYTYAELHERSQLIAAKLQSLGLEGKRALLLYPAGIEFVCAFFGCLYAGVIAVPAPPPVPSRLKRTLPRLSSIIRDCDAAIVMTETSAHLDQQVRQSMKSGNELAWLETDLLEGCEGLTYQPFEPASDTLAYLQYTSGSIGDPKGTEISHQNLVAQSAYLQRFGTYTDQSVTVTWMPNFHDWGLVEGLMLPIFNQTPCYIMSPIAFLKRPLNWLRAISKYRGTHSQGPTFAYEHSVRRISNDEDRQLDLSCWQSAGIAAEPINYHVMRDFFDKFRTEGFEWKTFNPMFGMGESTLIVALTAIDDEPTVLHLDPHELEKNVVTVSDDVENSRVVVASGQAWGVTRLAIVDPVTKTEQPDSRVGELWVSDPCVAMGYWRRQPETEETFRACLDNGEGPFLRTGDLGFLREGKLFITGRWKDLVIIRGTNHYPQDIEWTAQSVDQSLTGQTGAAFSVLDDENTERLVLLQEVDRKQLHNRDLKKILSAIVVAIADIHELDVYEIILLKRGTIPKTASGKIQRRSSRQLYQNQELSPIESWRRNESNVPKKKGHHHVSANEPEASGDLTSNQSESKADQLIGWLRQYASTRINSFLMDARRSVPPYIILDFGNQGLFGLQVPKKYGGLELGFVDTCRVLQQLAAIDFSLGTLVFLSNTNGLLPIVNYASDEIKQQLLPSLAQGRGLAAFALSEPSAGANIGAISTRAERIKDFSYSLSGTKRWNGSSWADVITVIARESDPSSDFERISAFLVQQGQPGLSVGEESLTMGLRGIVQNSLHMKNLEVSKSHRLGEGGDGWTIVNHTLSLGRLCTSAVCLGGMKRTLQLLHRYTSRRSISTGLLGDHPLVREKLSAIISQIETVERVTEEIAHQLDAGIKVPQLVMMAIKVVASDSLNQITSDAIQLMGGRGFMENNEVSRIFRDARALSVGEGPNESLTGFIGQPQNHDAILKWIELMNGTKRHESFAETREQIETICRSRSDLSGAQRHFWSCHLSGTLAVELLLLVTIEKLADQVSDATLSWIRNRFEESLKQSVRKAQTDAGFRPATEIETLISGLERGIGNVHQTLPGEDTTIDPLLQPINETSNATQPLDRIESNSEKPVDRKKQLLEVLLAKKSQNPQVQTPQK